MILISFLLAVLASPWKAVASIGRAVFQKKIDAPSFGGMFPHVIGKRANGSPIWSIAGGMIHQALCESIHVAMVTLPLLRTDGAVKSKTTDTTFYEFFEFYVPVGATDGTVDVKLQECTAADGTGSVTDVTGALITQIAATDDNRMAVISVAKSLLTKRYLLALVTVASSSTGANYSVIVAAYGKAGQLPETQQAAGANSYLTVDPVKVS